VSIAYNNEENIVQCTKIFLTEDRHGLYFWAIKAIMLYGAPQKQGEPSINPKEVK
jgi:hypothetical protein